MSFWEIVAAVGIPGAVISGAVGFLFHRIEKRLDKEAKEREKQEAARREFEKFQIRSMTATMALCEANAIALQNGKCNGETHRALEYMTEVKHDQRDFLAGQGIDHIF